MELLAEAIEKYFSARFLRKEWALHGGNEGEWMASTTHTLGNHT